MISLCMIGQDEENCVKENLLDLIDYVDEIVFVDGGSEDRTVEIVGSIPKARVFYHPFKRHFANQKNQAIEHAKGDYILFKDCDEVFEQDVLDNLDMLMIEYSDHDAFAFWRKTYIGGKLDGLHRMNWLVRFWLNKPSIRYEGRMAERIVGHNNLLKCNLGIIHDKTVDMQRKDNKLYSTVKEDFPDWRKEK